MSRFILNLRTVNMQGEQVWNSTTPPSEACLVRSMVGNLGALMDMGDDDDENRRIQQESKGDALEARCIEEVSVETEIRRLQGLGYRDLEKHGQEVRLEGGLSH